MSANRGNKIRHHPERGNAKLKFFDRYLGIPLVYGLGLFKKKSHYVVPDEVRKAAFLHTAAIGDTVISSAMVQDFKRAFPNSHITFFTGSSNHETACLIPGIDVVSKLSVKSPLEAVKQIKNAGSFEVWFDCGPWPRLNAIYTFFADAAVKIGFQTDKQYRHYVYDRAVRHSSHVHEIENYRNLLHAFGIKDCGSLPFLRTDGSRRIPGRIAIHMFPGGSRSYLKEWPDDRWSDLISMLVAKGNTVFLTGTAVNRERAVAIQERVKDRERVTVVAGMQKLLEVMGLLRSSQLVISVDTGIMHIASALGCNLISLHGPTSPRRWGPLNADAIPLHANIACSPCLSLGFESGCNDPKCMQAISVDDVYSHVERLLNQ